MRDILDQADIWIGAPLGAQVFGNKRPVAMDDTLTVPQDSGPVTISVLANDFDPEGGPLTLVSASAALGTAVAEANNTITYTPPPGIAGSDTVVYEISDDQGQIDAGQVNITVAALGLAISVETDNTMRVTAGTGSIEVVVTAPAAFAGTYIFDVDDLVSGPLNLVVPGISGTVEVGQVLTATNGLWVYDTGAGVPTQSWQWQRAGVDIAGAAGPSYTVQSGDVGPGLSVVEGLSDGSGTRLAASDPVGTGFVPADDPSLIGWWDASDAATITSTGGAVSSWADKAGGGPAMTSASSPQPPVTGARSLNGLNILDFGGGHHLEALRSFPASGDVAFHMVVDIDSVSNVFEAILAIEAVNDFQIDANAATQFDGRFNASGIGTATALSGGPFSGPQILSVVMDRTGAEMVQVFLGGTLRAGTAYTAPLDQTAAMHLMTNRSKNAWVNGAVAEVIVTGDTGSQVQYHSYLSTKWGVS